MGLTEGRRGRREGEREEERKKGTESLFKEIMAKNFPYLRKKMGIQIQEVQWIQTRMNPKDPH